MTAKAKKIIVNGAFDIVHVGHLSLLNYAKSLGDYLLVAIDSDKRIKKLKGNSRPINTLAERYALISNLKAVDEVTTFDSEQELIDIIKKYEPDVMVKGDDWKGKAVVGEQYCKSIKFYKRDNELSTTNKINDIISRG